MNAQRERQVDAAQDAATLCAAALTRLQAGEHAYVRELIAGLHGATGAAGGPIVAQLVKAAQRLAAAWSELCDRATREEQTLAETRERAARFARQLHGIVDSVRDALTGADGHAASRSAAPSGSIAMVHTLKMPAERQAPPSAVARAVAPILAVSVLGPFRAAVNERVIEDWPNCRSKAIFKYLLLNRSHPVAREALMERFWPEAHPEAARNSLNVAIHRLRRALGRDGSRLVLFSGGHYLLDPQLVVSIDAEEFLAHAARGTQLERSGDENGAIREYAASVALYRGELLAEDRYAHDEWLLPLRQQFRDRYLHVLDRMGEIHFDRQDVPACMSDCARMLAVDACNEGAHRMLMRCYGRLGQPQLAQRQYQSCIQVLNRELGIPTSAETTELYRQIVRRKAV